MAGADRSHTKLHISKDPMSIMLREGCVKEFNAKKLPEKHVIFGDAICAVSTFEAWTPTDWISATAIFGSPTSEVST